MGLFQRWRSVSTWRVFGLLSVIAGAVLAPAPLVVAAASPCVVGGPPPGSIPEAPWQPLLLLAGAGAVVLWRRRAPRRTDAQRQASGRRGPGRLAMLAGRVFLLVLILSLTVGLATAAIWSAAACTPHPGPVGGILPVTTVSTPSVGSGQLLALAVALLVAGISVAVFSLLLRPRDMKRS